MSDAMMSSAPTPHDIGVTVIRRRIPRRWGSVVRRHWPIVLTLLVGACSLDGLLKSNELPPEVTDPAITATPAGAAAAYNGTLASFQTVFGSGDVGFLAQQVGGSPFIATTGVLSDELTAFSADLNILATVAQEDLRSLAESSNLDDITGLFKDLNHVRQRARQAGGLLTDYVPDQPALRAHLYAVEGYTEVMLAELFCSGIPLSTVDYKANYTLRPGATTSEVLSHAVALFDTALTLAGDSARFMHLAQVGKARALLGMDSLVAAAAAAAAVPDTFTYALRFSTQPGARGFGYFGPAAYYTVADREGTNGLDYRSSGDPRTQATLLPNGQYHPNKYHVDGLDTVVVASGVEARLIEAEAALQAGDVGTWLAMLNHLRQTAITPALPDTTDPGTAAARVDLLFRERAFWLFLTGHRQGDLRRLIRQYHRLESQVYPTGISAYGLRYGTYVDVPIPTMERVLNPLFTGCAARD